MSKFYSKRSGTKTDINDLLNLQINLPDGYNPLASLDQTEALLKFTNKAYHNFSDSTNIVSLYIFF
jgi:hypothetical protein